MVDAEIGSRCVGQVISDVCYLYAYVYVCVSAGLSIRLCVLALNGKRLKLSAQNLVGIYCTTVARHA